MRAAFVAAILLAVAPAAQAKPQVRCGSGFTVVRDGRLSIIGVERRGGEVGLYACLGRRRPFSIGDDTAQVATFDGVRYVGILSIRTGGEGPADASYDVVDVVARRRVTSVPSVDSFDEIDPFRVTAAGGLVRDDYGIQVIRPGFEGDARLIKPIGTGNELAYVGATIYWTEPTQTASLARSMTVTPALARPETHVYDLRRLATGALLHRRGPCARVRGRIVAASAHVRVVARDGVRRACAIGKAWLQKIGPGTLRIAGDRWLLRTTATRATVIDGRNGEVVTDVTEATVGTTITERGALAWLEPSGRLLAQAPRAAAPVVLADASAAVTALASSNETIYWTAGGVAHRWQR